MIRTARTKLTRTALCLLALTAATLSLTACGDSDSPSSQSTVPPTSPSSSSSTTPTEDPTDLTFTVSGSDITPEGPKTYTLTCNPDGGTLPAARQACINLNKIIRPFVATAPNRVCADVVGGNGSMTIKGIYKGSTIDTTADQRDSCATKRFNRIAVAIGLKERTGSTAPPPTTTPPTVP